MSFSPRSVRQLAWCLAAAVLVPVSSGAAERDTAASESLDCVINPSVVADLGSAVPGVLSAVRVDRSDFIEKGATLAELESGAETATVELARARAALTAEVDLRRTNAAFGNRQHERSRDLFDRKVISTNEMDERRTEARVANIQLRQALDNQRLAKLEQVRAEEMLHRRVIHSPITGVVMERFKSVGEYVEDQPVVRVAQLDPLHIEVIVPVEQLGDVKPGMQAEVWADAVGTETWKATVTRVDRVADVASGTYGVRLSLPNPDYRIPAGLRCQMAWVEGAFDAVAAEEPANAPGPSTAAPAIPESKEHPVVATEIVSGASTDPDARDRRPALETLEEGAADVPVGVDNIGTSMPAAVAEAEPIDLALPACRLVGPFETRREANSQARALRQQGLDVALETHNVRARVGYQVVIPDIPSREAADRLIARFAAAGIDDYFMKHRKRPPHEISLGLYKGTETAEGHVDVLRAKGFDAAVIPWLKKADRSFLAIRGALDDTALAALDVLPTPEPGTLMPNAACERLAGR